LAALLIAASATFEVPGLYASGAAWAQTGGSATANAGAADETMFTVEDLNSLVAPIALFPDELLGLVLTASTEPLQIVQAQRFLDRREKKPDLKANESWHTSVIGLLNYPELIKLMGDDLEWTEQLGLAFVYQHRNPSCHASCRSFMIGHRSTLRRQPRLAQTQSEIRSKSAPDQSSEANS
jgi:hypothetical protein